MAALNSYWTPIESFVIFDIEATGLPDGQRPPKITEFCMLAVNRNDLIYTDGRPRVMNRLQICVNPNKPIPLIVSQITGLYNDHLENQKTFDIELVRLINGFLGRLPQPICLLAHNGHGFDFPLLKAQLLEVNESLLDGILCSDSLIAFRDIAGEVPWETHLPFLTPSKDIGMSNPLRSEDTQCALIIPRPVEASQNIRLVHQVLIDENMNLSADVLPNQNIHINNNNDQVLDLEEMLNSTPPENGVHLVDLQGNHSQNFQNMITTPPRNDSPIWEDDAAREAYPALVDEQVRARHGSPINDDGDMNLDPLNFRFSNENTPVKRLDIGHMAPRKVIPPKQRVAPGKTRRQLNFEMPESIVVVSPMPNKSNQTKSTLDLRKTKRQLDFDMNDPIVQSNIESGSSCSNFEKLNIENCESRPKRLCSNEQESSHSGITAINNSATNSQPLQIDTDGLVVPGIAPSSFENEECICAVEDNEEMYNNSEESLKLKLLDVKSEKRSPSDETPLNEVQNYSESSVASGSKTSVQHTFSVAQSYPKTTQSVSKDNAKRLSYALVNLYTRTFGRSPAVSHTSEDDCLVLLELIKIQSTEFIKWIDNHSIQFSEVKPMY